MFSVSFYILLAFASLPAPTAKAVEACEKFFSTEQIASVISRLPRSLILNTSNPDKQKDFINIFNRFAKTVTFRNTDLAEIKASPLEVIAHKASHFRNPNELVLVEDTSLDVEGVDIGINVRWLQASLKNHIGRRAIWRALMGVRVQNHVLVFEGVVSGRIGAASGEGFGFDPLFIPDGSTLTLAEYKPHQYNARAIAVEQFTLHKPLAVVPVIEEWQGPWQEAEH